MFPNRSPAPTKVADEPARRVLSATEVETFSVGDPVGLAPRDHEENGKSPETFVAFMACFVVRSFLL